MVTNHPHAHSLGFARSELLDLAFVDPDLGLAIVHGDDLNLLAVFRPSEYPLRNCEEICHPNTLTVRTIHHASRTATHVVSFCERIVTKGSGLFVDEQADSYLTLTNAGISISAPVKGEIMSRTINRRWLAALTGGCALLAGLLLASTTPAGAQLRPDPVFECDYRVEADGSISAIIAIANDVPFGDDVTINFRDNRWISTFVPNPDAQADVATVSRIPDIAIIRINDQDRVDIACNPL